MQTESKTQLAARLRLVMLVLLSSLLMSVCAVSAGAATKNGFVKVGSKTYYYENGKKHAGWLTLGNKKYYFKKKTKVMATGWLNSSKGRRYFDKSTGVMVTGWVSYENDNKRYFSESKGFMATGWLKIGTARYYMNPETGYALKGFQKIGEYYRYFYSKSGALARGWLTNSQGEKRYFNTDASNALDGAMSTGFAEIGGKTYYFKPNNGKMVLGWKVIDGNRYYFQDDGSMATGTVNINGKEYEFSSDGIYQGSDSSLEPGELSVSNGEKTIKNYLLGALIPVGKVLYVWGGGWNDANRIGLSPTWTQWYNSQNKNYDYQRYSDLTRENRAKGLDCSGFVGWATYQVMHKTSGEHYGYTVVSGEVGSYYTSLGWGTTINQNYLSKNNYTLKAGDIGYNAGHVWLVLGQCKDKSVVIVHSTTQAGVQIAGTSTPNGNSSSEAVALARKYMSRYPGTKKYEYHPSAGNYIPRYNYFRWNRKTLADPDGYMGMYADEILLDLFGS